jgi:hypothetical protein
LAGGGITALAGSVITTLFGATFGAAGTGVGAAAAVAAAPFVVPILPIVGLVAGGALLAPRVSQVLFPRERAKENNTEVKKSDLSYKYWDCYHVKISITGQKGSGKSTIREFLREKSTDQIPSSASTTYYLLCLDANSHTYGVLIDNKGSEDTWGEQISLASIADVIVVVFDHFNTRDKHRPSEKAFDDSRRQEHENFCNKLFGTIKELMAKGSGHASPSVILLMTKKDLWQKGTDRIKIETWMKAITAKISDEFGNSIFDKLEIRAFDRTDEDDRAWLIRTIVAKARARG